MKRPMRAWILAIIRGFKGRYRVTWTDASGAATTREFELAKDGDGLEAPRALR